MTPVQEDAATTISIDVRTSHEGGAERMAFFDPPSVRALKKDTEIIGGLFGQVHLGHLAPEHLRELVQDERQRSDLQDAFARASAEVGAEKAMRAARKGANLGADAYARLGNGAYGHVIAAAESAVQGMLGK